MDLKLLAIYRKSTLISFSNVFLNRLNDILERPLTLESSHSDIAAITTAVPAADSSGAALFALNNNAEFCLFLFDKIFQHQETNYKIVCFFSGLQLIFFK